MSSSVSNQQSDIKKEFSKAYLKKVKSRMDLRLKLNRRNITIKDRCHSEEIKVVKYRLEGNIIRLYVFENGVKKECIRTIPLNQATPEILSQVENLSFLDMFTIIEKQKKDKKKPNNK